MDSEQASTGRTRKVRADKGVPRAGAVPSKALAEIDRRLTQAIADRMEASKNVSKLVYWQQKVIALEQEINTLIGYAQQLSGKPAVPPRIPQVDPMEVLAKTSYSFTGDIPSNIGSIPASERPRGPRPTSTNAGDEVKNEGGFQ